MAVWRIKRDHVFQTMGTFRAKLLRATGDAHRFFEIAAAIGALQFGNHKISIVLVSSGSPQFSPIEPKVAHEKQTNDFVIKTEQCTK